MVYNAHHRHETIVKVAHRTLLESENYGQTTRKCATEQPSMSLEGHRAHQCSRLANLFILSHFVCSHNCNCIVCEIQHTQNPAPFNCIMMDVAPRALRDGFHFHRSRSGGGRVGWVKTHSVAQKFSVIAFQCAIQ